MRREAGGGTHDADGAVAELDALQGALAALGDGAGPLPRFTLAMLSRDLADVAAALRPENNDRAS